MEVVGYHPQQGSQTFDTVCGVLVFDHPSNGQIDHILVFHQATHMQYLDHPLCCPMQCHVNDVTVNGVQKTKTCFHTDNILT